MKRRFTILSVAVLGFYLFYALAPLLYSIEVVQAEEQSGNLPGLFIAGSQPSYVDQSLLSAAYRQDDDSTPAARVLLKKKRAVPVSFKNIIEKLSLRYTKIFESTPFFSLAGNCSRISNDSPICPNGFQFFHSGISPPSA